jgi:hypothetical protein
MLTEKNHRGAKNIFEIHICAVALRRYRITLHCYRATLRCYLAATSRLQARNNFVADLQRDRSACDTATTRGKDICLIRDTNPLNFSRLRSPVIRHELQHERSWNGNASEAVA